jgi:alkylhydroperoxidase/carboxymuconolactone decarboxylase family protein YurZ
MPSDIDIPAAVAKLKPIYDAFQESGGLRELLRSIFEADFALSGYPTTSDPLVANSSAVSLYLSSIEQAFYQGRPAPGRIANEDRERVVLALLTSQGAGRNLAIHVYLALMEGVQAVEIIDILFLSGIYSGVNLLSQSLKVADAVFLEVVAISATDPLPNVPDTLKRIVAKVP